MAHLHDSFPPQSSNETHDLTMVHKLTSPWLFILSFLMFLFAFFFKTVLGTPRPGFWTAGVFSMNVRAQAVDMAAQAYGT
ncbi:hypothetical protein AJ80_06443 [Polytolypa hystricis UAMH7299]|uniref:Uncharacterized protein n=1 Tax=Polytolypa hystricis (strain UAMH7299) TaxID=1447883 RepID=A0A2B7XXI9_POLH7|nr:hypothetical protein AJ80_06443 [Polytolypa hystricis UAMH7299]